MHLLWAMCLVLGLLLALLAPGLAKAAPAAGPLGALQGTLGGGSASDKERSNAIQTQLDAAASATKEADALAQELDRMRARARTPVPPLPAPLSDEQLGSLFDRWKERVPANASQEVLERLLADERDAIAALKAGIEKSAADQANLVSQPGPGRIDLSILQQRAQENAEPVTAEPGEAPDLTQARQARRSAEHRRALLELALRQEEQSTIEARQRLLAAQLQAQRRELLERMPRAAWLTQRIAERSRQQLEQQVQERSRQLVRSERLAGVGFLAAGVAHEINNPLASIAFCSEALESRIGGLPGPADDPDRRVVANYLKMIQEEAFRCKSITEKLLDFARCGDIKRERADLPSLIQGVVDMIRHIGKYRGKSIVFQPKEAVLAHVDGQEIKQVVLNLAVNALESMDAGGTLRIEARYDQGMAEIGFVDDGCGMEAEVLENIFEPFFTRRRDGKGTGLGLSITHRIVNQHHGEITAASAGPGKGSTFRVRLPIHPSEKADARRRDPTAPQVHAA